MVGSIEQADPSDRPPAVDSTAQAPSGSVARTLQLLEALAEARGDTSLQSLSRTLGMAPSTVHRLLVRLIESGFAESDPVTRRYRVGPAFYRVAGLVAAGFSMETQARPLMQDLSQHTGETVILARYDAARQTMYFVESIQSPNALGYNVELLTPQPLVWGATSKAILALLPDEEIELIRVSSRPSPATSDPVPSNEDLFREVREIRRRGYAQSHDEKLSGASSVAAAISAAGGRAVGSLALTLPAFRATEDRLAELGPLVQGAAAQLSRLLGG